MLRPSLPSRPPPFMFTNVVDFVPNLRFCYIENFKIVLYRLDEIRRWRLEIGYVTAPINFKADTTNLTLLQSKPGLSVCVWHGTNMKHKNYEGALASAQCHNPCTWKNRNLEDFQKPNPWRNPQLGRS